MPAGSGPHGRHPTDASGPFSKKSNKRKTASRGGHSDGQRPTKQRKTGPSNTLQSSDAVKHALLSQYYPTLLTLRQYVLVNLPASSRIRRRKIAAIGTEHLNAGRAGNNLDSNRAELARLLDTTLVGLHAGPEKIAKAESESRLQQWIDYSQRDDSRVTLSDGDASAIHFQSEIVDFIVWLLFSREKSHSKRPRHLLCDGFRKSIGPRQLGAPSSIQGLYSLYFNERVASVKQAPWPQLLQLLGKSGESMMINILLDCSIFLPVEAGRSNYYQLSGTPIIECEPISRQTASGPEIRSTRFERKPTDILFVRSRMLYARAALNARGLVHFGLRHIHALNRFARHPVGSSKSVEVGDGIGKSHKDANNTVRIMMYMFPRQFGLHNAFTSHVDSTMTAQKFQDYTLREEEISSKFRTTSEDGSQYLAVRVPKRLRGRLEDLVQRLQTLHARCSYAKLLQHYCPIDQVVSEEGSQCHSSSARAAPLTNKLSGKVSRGRGKPRQLSGPEPRTKSYSSLTKLAVPISRVSAFCQAVLSKIIPHEFWGIGDVHNQNIETFLRNVDRFIKLRRFETSSLHEVVQGMKITEIDWLQPPGLKTQKCSQTDFCKRIEIFSEFVYYLFDSLLIPLIRSNFYVTESNVHRYRLFFFRHDVWRSVTEPAMADLKAKMFEEVKLEEALNILDSRRLGYSQVRLLPKQMSVRPIMNLRRRMITSKDKKILGSSINSILGPVSNMLKLEKDLHASRLGSAMFSVGDLYRRIGRFKQHIGPDHGPLYFAKVDVQAAFDTIPQAAIISLMNSVPSHARYEMIRHVEVAPNEGDTIASSKVIKRWHTSAKAGGDTTTFLEMLARQIAPSKKNAVCVDGIFRKAYSTRDLLALTASHIQQNLVKIGKKYYRQKEGIPQGSVISSVLCNYFYADLERTRLQFLHADDSLLIRLIDDFLLITTDQTKASRFVTVMQGGIPEYGVRVSPSKTLVNFAVSVDGAPVPTIRDGNSRFPYCGTHINTHNLEITKDRDTTYAGATRDPTVSNALTVEFTRRPGQNFKRKTLNAFKLQSHLMFFDARHNSRQTVLRSLSEALVETATKAWAYARCLAGPTQPGPKLWVETIDDLAEVAYLLLTSRARRMRYPTYECRVTRTQVRLLTLGSFRTVLGRKQAQYGEVLAWLGVELGKLAGGKARGLDGRHVAALL